MADEHEVPQRQNDRRLLEDNNLSAGPPGTDPEQFDAAKSGNVKDLRSTRRRNSRSKSPRRRRRSRSKSRSFSPDRRRRRFEERDPRLRNRRSRSRERRGRNRSQSRERDNNRFGVRRSRSNSRTRRNWSPPKKKGPVSPPPIQQPPPMQPNFNMAPPGMYDDRGYNNYQGDMNYGQNTVYSPYNYPPVMPVGQTFPSYPPPPSMQPIPPGDDFQQVPWNIPPNQMVPPPMAVPPPEPQVPQPPAIVMQTHQTESPEEKQKREAAVAQEKKNQRETLRKQRQDYKRRSNALKRELGILKEQREDLQAGSEPPSPTTKGFLKENDRLQLQIENKINTIENVIDMLSGIIGTDGSPSPPPPPEPPVIMQSSEQSSSRKSKKKSSKSDDDESSPERLKNKVIESLQKKKHSSSSSSRSRDDKDAKKEARKEKEKTISEDVGFKKEKSSPEVKHVEKIKPVNYINYVHYDPEMHWCRVCDVFPKTAKDYLTHLHSQEHVAMQGAVESPWHDKPITDELPTYVDAPSKRTPIRGLQFFIPSTGWYCKLCSIWMGDLHCASLHLKSRTHAARYTDYSDQNPHFEVDWMADRQKAYELSRQTQIQLAPPPPILSTRVDNINTSSSMHHSQMIASEGIPLQLQSISSLVRKSSPNDDDYDNTSPIADKKKKKKKLKEERKDKRKKKRSKRRRQSSSSSSSSSSSDSDDDIKDEATAAAQSIRVAMRNLLKQQSQKKQEAAAAAAAAANVSISDDIPDDQTGKWTVVQQAQTGPPPPPPTISENGASNNKRDDLMISQWNTHEPIITEKEKKLLEQLKGRLKNRSIERDSNSRSKDDRLSNTVTTRRSRDLSRDRRRSRSRDRNDRRNRRSRSRGGGGRRSRSRSRTPPRWGRSRRSRSRSHSRPRGRGRVEKPIVRYPEFRPRVPEKDKEKEREKERDRKRSTRNEGDDSTAGNNAGDKKTVIVLKKPSNKKLPFIGRMPVFKKQANDEEPKKDENLTIDKLPPAIIYNVAPAPPPPIHGPALPPPGGYHHSYDNMQHMQMEDYDDLMPDPMQFVSLMGAPPPPPMVPPPSSIDKNEPVLPPGIDEADVDAVPKPISDAPLPRKGPLPQDFQDALSIIFPGEKKPNGEEATIGEGQQNSVQQSLQMIEQPEISTATTLGLISATEDQSQHSMDIYGAAFPMHLTATGILQQQQDMSFAEDVDIPDVVIPTTQTVSGDIAAAVAVAAAAAEEDEKQSNNDSEIEKKMSRLDELNDLAMLGIDTDDLAAQCM